MTTLTLFMNRSFKSGICVLFVFLLSPSYISKGCGPSYTQFQGYSFLISSILDPQAPASFLPRFESLYENYGKQEVVQPQDNTREWQERFCDIPKYEDVYELVYTTDVDLLRQLYTSAASDQIPLSYYLANNTFARYLDNHKCLETIAYLIFAKQCEPHVTPKDPWDDTPRNINIMKRLIDAARQDFLTLKSHYIRLRYAYQMIRLAHYAKDYQGVLELYDYLMPKTDNEPSIIDYWIEGHRAGALKALGRHVEASYLYAQIFVNCASKRESAFQSFYIKNDEEWDACLRLCKSDEERAALYCLRAYEDQSRAVEEMRNIYELDPQNSNLEPLLVNEIKELEKDLLGLAFNSHKATNKRYFNLPRPKAADYAIELTQFAQRLADEKKVKRPDFWRMAQGYLELIKGDNYAADRAFRLAEQGIKDDILKEQIKVFRLALQINSLNYLDYQEDPEGVEKTIDRIRRNKEIFGRYRYFQDFLQDKMAYMYQQANSKGKAFLTQYELNDLKPNPQMDIIDRLLAITRKEDLTRVERDMITKEDGVTTIENDLIDMKASIQLADFRLEAALETYKEMDSRTNWDDYGTFKPFYENFSECVYCRSVPDTLEDFNKGELMERLLSMDYRSKADPQNSGRIFYEMGLAYYNMTYFGHAWQITDYFRSGSSMSPYQLRDGDYVMYHPFFPFGNKENMNCNKALEYFDKAVQFSSDPELTAKAAYMAAKCERNNYLLKRYQQDAEPTYQYFEVLRENPIDSGFYQDVVMECKTFQAYIASFSR
jgi:hypothetical protein